MIRHMFVFGVILPTLVTVLLFVAFLVCWFKFNMRERLFSKRKLFSKQLKHAMAPGCSASTKQSHIYTPEPAQQNRRDTSGTGNGSGGSIGGGGGGLSVTAAAAALCGSGTGMAASRKKPRRYENCVSTGVGASGKQQQEEEDEEMHEHSVGDDPEAALCGACEDEAMHAHANKLSGFANPNLCVSPSHSTAGDDEAEDDDDDDVDDDDEEEIEAGSARDGRGRKCTIGGVEEATEAAEAEEEEEEEEEEQNHTDTEDHTMAATQYVQVKQVGSMFQYTFHFPASECSHLSNSLAVDSEDGGSEDGNYGHFVPLSQLLRDPKAKQFYAAAARSRADSPAAMDFSDGGGGCGSGGAGCIETTIDVNCTDKARLIPSA